MRYLESRSTDPAFNLALEQYVFDTLSPDEDFFMLWQNRDAVIVGLHQNTAEEINREYIEQNGIAVVRRLSGGGAVFHDSGNLNFSFITRASDAGNLDFADSCLPIVKALSSLGIHVELVGRNDLTIGGRKFSGNARYLRDGRLMHHGTLLFDTDLQKMTAALHVSEDKIISKGIQSVRSRVTNIREHLSRDMTIHDFWAFMRTSVADGQNMPEYTLSEQHLEAVRAIRRERYTTWEWNFGRSPDYSIKKLRRLPDFGAIRIGMDVESGVITAFSTDGDYFGNNSYQDVAAALLHVRLEKNALLDALSPLPIDAYYSGLSKEEFVRLIAE